VTALLDEHQQATLAPDLVQRDFTASAPNRLWVTDLTMIATGEGPLWLSAIRDAFSRRVVAWETSARADADLVLSTLEYALASREVEPGQLIHHANQGCQYTSIKLNYPALGEAPIACTGSSPGGVQPRAGMLATDKKWLSCRFRGSLTWADTQNTPYPGYVSTCDGTKWKNLDTARALHNHSGEESAGEDQAVAPAMLRHMVAALRHASTQRFIWSSFGMAMHASAHISQARAHMAHISAAIGERRTIMSVHMRVMSVQSIRARMTCICASPPPLI
jgi:hypothetical protein